MKKQIYDSYLLPFIIILALPLLIDALSKNHSRYYLAFAFSIIIALSIRMIFNIKPFVFVLISFPVLFLSINYDVMVLEYKSYINITTWYAVFNTDHSESVDFISSTTNKTKFLVGFQILTYLIYLLCCYNKKIAYTGKRLKKILLILLLFFSIDFVVKGATKIGFPLRGIEGFYQYTSTKITEAKYLNIKRNATLNATRNSAFDKNAKETVVVVVGESLRRDHLEYYGYRRPTTPLMKKEDFIVFSDAISPANQTINSLKRIFTRAEMLNENNYWKEPSLIKAFKETGFATYWITTQPVYGRHESEASFIGEETDEFIDENRKTHGYDEYLLNSYKKVLHDNVRKKIIFLHIMSNHAGYYKRYPKKFNTFAQTNDSDKRMHLMNLYDNAVRYNDYFLHQVLSLLKKVGGEKSLIMFSDHGESLFDTPNLCYHGSANPSKSEYNVPLIVWLSDEFKSKHPLLINELNDNKNKPILLSDMFYALPDLFGIRFEKFNPDNSFFTRTYKSKLHRKVVNVNLELLDYENLSSKK
jgi:glucan phosphoethanolaminetransferase (alkaline phosphatase superfamily)